MAASDTTPDTKNIIKQMQKSRAFFPQLTILAILVALVTAFWAPTLFSNRVLVHGDSVFHGLSLWDYYSQNLDQLSNLLWNRNTYGGHPLFAEGQGSFLFPLNALLVHLMTPIYANSFAHWAQMIVAGVAVYGLSRTLNLSTWASGFAALATVFSSYWLHMQENMTISATAMCVPWFIWAAECWFQRPGYRTSILLGIATAMTIFAGYPHHLQGAAVYLVISLLPNMLEKESRNELIAKFSILWKTGLFAVLTGIGLAAIQLLPLVELTQYSHRATGAAPIYFHEPLDHYIRGMLYILRAHEFDSPNFIPSIGSSLVVLAFTLTIFFKLPTRIKGHFVATLLLLNLAMGGTSPITSFLYSWHMIPGMHYFRVMIPYFIVAAVGVGIMAGFSIDRLSVALKGFDRYRIANYFLSWREKFTAVIFVAFWVFALYRVGVPFPIGSKHMAFAGLGIITVALSTAAKRTPLIPILLFFVLALEVASLKLDEYVFVAPSALNKPETVNIIERDDPHKNYKVYSASMSFLSMMGSPHQEHLADNIQSVLAHLVGLSNLRWNIPSMMGSTALQLREGTFIHPTIVAETNGISDSPAGLRLIDLLGVKYIAADGPREAPGFHLKFHDPVTNTWLMENSAAKPRFQVYTNYRIVEDSQEALEALQATSVPLLALQLTDFMTPKIGAVIAPASPDKESEISFSLKKDTFTHYELSTQAAEPGWLFLADSNYPGWHAYIDGVETPVYTAQILGKAIAIPQGDHEVTLIFKSASFRLGLWLTAATLLAIVIVSIMLIAGRSRYTDARLAKKLQHHE